MSRPDMTTHPLDAELIRRTLARTDRQVCWLSGTADAIEQQAGVIAELMRDAHAPEIDASRDMLAAFGPTHHRRQPPADAFDTHTQMQAALLGLARQLPVERRPDLDALSHALERVCAFDVLSIRVLDATDALEAPAPEVPGARLEFPSSDDLPRTELKDVAPELAQRLGAVVADTLSGLHFDGLPEPRAERPWEITGVLEIDWQQATLFDANVGTLAWLFDASRPGTGGEPELRQVTPDGQSGDALLTRVSAHPQFATFREALAAAAQHDVRRIQISGATSLAEPHYFRVEEVTFVRMVRSITVPAPRTSTTSPDVERLVAHHMSRVARGAAAAEIANAPTDRPHRQMVTIEGDLRNSPYSVRTTVRQRVGLPELV